MGTSAEYVFTYICTYVYIKTDIKLLTDQSKCQEVITALKISVLRVCGRYWLVLKRGTFLVLFLAHLFFFFAIVTISYCEW